MSKTWVWIATGLSTAFLSTAGVVLGTRLVNAPPGNPGSGEARAVQLQQAQGEVDHLKRLLAAYRDREAVYRKHLAAYRDREAVYRKRLAAYRDREDAYRKRLAAYRDREAVYQQRLNQANRLIEQLSARPRGEYWSRWEDHSRWERGEDDDYDEYAKARGEHWSRREARSEREWEDHDEHEEDDD